MLITFQVLLFVLIILFGMGLFADYDHVDYEDKNRYVAVVLAAIIAECVSFFLG